MHLLRSSYPELVMQLESNEVDVATLEMLKLSTSHTRTKSTREILEDFPSQVETMRHKAIRHGTDHVEMSDISGPRGIS